MQLIVVRNLEESESFEKKVRETVLAESKLIEKLVRDVFDEPIEVFLVKDLERFVDKEFIDIEKLRIFAKYLITEELPIIHAISVLDKIVIERGENVKGSLIHAILHAIMYMHVDPFHYVDNYMELKFHREDIVRYLVHHLDRSQIENALKLTEKTYLYILSSLKHFSIYKYATDRELDEIIKADILGLEEWISKSVGREKIDLEDRIKLTSYAVILESLGFTLSMPRDLYIENVAKHTLDILVRRPKLRSYREPNEVLKRAIDISLRAMKGTIK